MTCKECQSAPVLLIARFPRHSTREIREHVRRSLMSELGERFKVVVLEDDVDAWVVSSDGIVQELKGNT